MKRGKKLVSSDNLLCWCQDTTIRLDFWTNVFSRVKECSCFSALHTDVLVFVA